MPKRNLIIFSILVLIGALAAGYSFLGRESGGLQPASQQPAQAPSSQDNQVAPQDQSGGATVPAPADGAPPQNKSAVFTAPIANAKARVTKKPFGIKVSPTNSPVSPEKFSGYHTGVDFEILSGEENIDVPVYAVIDGTVIYRNYVSGYGGVFIERAVMDGQEVTILYGHLDLASVGKVPGQEIKAGEKIGILGKGYSRETDGERKHLHLGIHKGREVELRGYVQDPKELNSWLDTMKYL